MPDATRDNSLHPAEAMILVGGKGTRLRSAVSDRPKPMAEVAGRPFVAWLLAMLHDQGIRRAVLCTGYLGDLVEAHFGDGRRWDMDLRYSRDPFPLGTGGAVRYALDRIEGDRFLVLNGDSYCRCDIALLASVHTRHHARATLWLVGSEDCRRYGSVLVGPDGAVQSFAEKPSAPESGLVNAGVYLIERAAAETIPAGRCVSLEREFFPGLVGHGLFAVASQDAFIDIGTPESYAGAEQFITQEANA
ncbi:MAG: nucleotidyltransferase family protein [Sedimentisphaerales bacterium]|nr:nucleotidyltransferase family protein [Sedimentisphaerales bacterium]